MSAHVVPSPSRLAAMGAVVVRDAFATYREVYRATTRRAQRSFESRDWRQVQLDASGRLALYRGAVDDAQAALRALLEDRVEDKLVWVAMKAVYSGLIERRQDWDLAETFFNSVTRRIFSTIGVDSLIEFVATDFERPPIRATREGWVAHPCRGDVTELVATVLRGTALDSPWDALDRDAALVAERIEREVEGEVSGAEVLRPVFFRGKGAYVIGRLHTDHGTVPLVLALRNPSAGLLVDAVLLDEADVSVLFGFTRSYFFVDTPRPYDVVLFLQELLPKKRRGELYIAIGEPKQGKTELYRDLLDHLETSGERFDFAPGIPGLVMVVFTAPGHSHVLKVIRDRFPPQKETSPARVRDRYRWVYAHDRAGRIVDAQCFQHLQLPREVFSEPLLEHLLEECGRTVFLEGDEVVLEVAYVERKVTPLDLYLRQVDEEEGERVMVEYGAAIRDLATCGIFPGDLLTKNFGVTRHGRVAFYDYDEVVPVRDVRFRVLPAARDWEDEMAAEPWFSVDPGDVFPEEFARFLGVPPALKDAMLRAHPSLFTATWWREVQERVARDRLVEVPPYPSERRLPEPWER